jgi:hypothetical protein
VSWETRPPPPTPLLLNVRPFEPVLCPLAFVGRGAVQLEDVMVISRCQSASSDTSDMTGFYLFPIGQCHYNKLSRIELQLGHTFTVELAIMVLLSLWSKDVIMTLSSGLRHQALGSLETSSVFTWHA